MAKRFIGLENLDYFHDKFKQNIDSDLWNWQKTEKAELVQFKPVPDSVLEPAVDFMFIETPPASGDKSPSNPSTITGVNSVKVTRTGKNLLPFPYESSTSSSNGITWTVNDDGSITADGTATADSGFSIVQSNNNNIIKDGFTYIVTGCPSGGSTSTYCIRFGSSASLSDIGNGQAFTANSYTIGQSIWIKIGSGTTVSNLVFRPQLELGSVATSFEPPSPVNTTISLDDTYYGGTLDVATGKMTVTWGAVVLDGTETWYKHDNSTEQVSVFCSGLNLPNYTMKEDMSASTRFCSHFSYSSDVVAGTFSSWGTASRVYFKMDAVNFPDVSDFTSWLASEYVAGHPVVLAYTRYAPLIVQLTPQQIKALPALDKYEPRINTVYTDQQSVQVGYQRYADEASNVDAVHKSGNETIEGVKTFISTINGSVSGNAGTVNGHSVAADVPANAVFTDTTYTDATTTTAGLMSAADKTKLDSVGAVFFFKGTVADSTALPSSGNTAGDAYVAEDDQHVYVWDGSAWSDIGGFDFIPPATNGQIDALFS